MEPQGGSASSIFLRSHPFLGRYLRRWKDSNWLYAAPLSTGLSVASSGLTHTSYFVPALHTLGS